MNFEDELSMLSPEERELALKILGDISNKGASEDYNKILYDDYEEIPVDIETFLHDRKYLGNALYDGEGRFTLFPYWEDLLKRIYPDPLAPAKCNTLALTGAIGLGKAQPLSSPVYTKDGYKPMGDIKVGEQVYGADGCLHSVVGVYPQGKRDIYKVTFADGVSTLCSDNHLWTVYDKRSNYREKVMTTLELVEAGLTRDSSIGRERIYSIPLVKPIQFEKKNLPIDPYIIGVLIGDGSLVGTISFTSADTDIIENVTSRLLEGYKLSGPTVLTYRITHTNKQYNNQFNHNPNIYCKAIKELNLNVTSENKFIPDIYLTSSVEDRIALLQGLLDTDGYINKNGSVIQYYTVSKKLADDVTFLIRTLGGYTRTSKHATSYINKEGERVRCKDSYTLNIKLPKDIKPFKLTRKLERINPRSNEPRRLIDSIEYVGVEECQCIYVDSDEHLYLTDDLIVTHNTLVAVTLGLYELYRMLCLKDPYVHYGLQPIDLITFAVINITMDAAKGVAWNKLQSMIQMSPWFMSHGTVNKADLPEWKPPKGIELIYGSQTRHVIGRAVYWCFEDEVSFQPNQDVEKQKEKAKTLVNTVTARMQSRFMHGDVNPTIFVLASSKRTEQSFMETFIEGKKKNESKTTWVIDEPQWIIRTDKNSDRKFKVAIGNKFLNSEVLPLNISEHDLQIYINKGFKILDVPIGYYESFLDDIDIALTDIAGISTSNVTRYIAGPRVAAIKKPNIQNLFTQDVIEVGDAPDDLTQYKDFFDMERLDLKMKSRPMYIHMDLSERGDKTGIAGVWIIGKKPHQEGVPDSKELYYRAAFSVSIKAPKGHAISFEKNRQFIYFLRESGFSIRGISTDTFQSFDTGQMLKAKGFNYETISVDRLTDRVCQPYLALKNAIYEERLELYENKLLTEELIGLERDSNGKIDHGPSGINSKDQADALCGALYNASKHAEEFAFEFGEDIEAMIQGSVGDQAYNKEQITLDFEEALKQTSPAYRQMKESDYFIDFGMGKAKPYQDQGYLLSGIIL